MLEDDQRFEELESKLAALSSQVESLELDTELDPFSEDDVRRTVDYFKSLELAGLESEDFGEEDFDDESSSDDFISVQTTGGPSFKTHWVAPTSCENMTRDLARDAFIQGAADRYGTSRQVNNGDVLILLCREDIPEEPTEGSEPAAPKEICRYIGLAYNTLIHPASAEPTSETEESISAPVGNYEIFVWSSCECSAEPAEPVVLPSIFEVSSESATNGNYASIGNDASPDMSNADGLLTEASIRKDSASSAEDIATGISSTITVTKNAAGYKAGLVSLSKDLTEYYLDRKSKTLNFEADKKNLNTHGFGSDLFVSKNLTLSNGECGNLETVSIAGETFDLALLKEGAGTHDSTFLTTAKISLGAAVSLDDTVAIGTYDIIPADINIGVGNSVFLPTVSDENADLIEPTVNLASLLQDHNVTIDAYYTVVYEDEGTGDAEYWIYQTKTNRTNLEWASGLLTKSGDETTLSRELVGVIRTTEVPLTYGCHPTYGCQLDPAGEYTDAYCDGSCEEEEELILTYRPPYIFVYDYDPIEDCYTLLGEHERDDQDERNDLANQYYSGEGRFTAEKRSDIKTEIFYVNDLEVPENYRFDPVPDDWLCETLENVLANLTVKDNGAVEIHSVEYAFQQTTADTTIRVRFQPLTIEDEISVSYLKDGVETFLIKEEVYTEDITDVAADENLSADRYAPGDEAGFYWDSLVIPAGAHRLRVKIDGTVSGKGTAWNYSIEKV